MKKYLSTILGILSFGTGSCATSNNGEFDGKENELNNNQSTFSLESVVDKESKLHIAGKSYSLSAEPIMAGRTSEIVVYDSRNSRFGKDVDKIEKIILYENGEIFKEVEGIILEAEVSSSQEAENFYHAKLITESGLEYNTENIKVNFSGELIDFLPTIEDFFASTTNAGKATNILVRAKDIGDNKGIKEIRLYEDGELIHTSDRNNYLLELITYNSKVEKSYDVEIEDLNGNIVRNEDSLIVNYSGQAFPPNITWNHSNNTEVGRTTTLLFEANDKNNLDDESGIVKAILYEDGKMLKEYNPSEPLKNKLSILEEITYDTSGIRTYHAEFFNGNGESIISEYLTVNFTGEDFQPEIKNFDIRYNDKNDITWVSINSNDKKNIRDDTGIQKIELFEDGILIEEVIERNSLYLKLGGERNNRQYQAVVTNYSGLVTKSDIISL